MGALEIGGGAGNGLAAPPLTRYELGAKYDYETTFRGSFARSAQLLEACLRPGRPRFGRL